MIVDPAAMDDNRLSAIESRLHGIEIVMERLEHTLLGNGQPGQLAVIEGRLKVLEEFKWRAVGFLGAAVFCYELVTKLMKG